mgnify:CR=1 FL=1
MSATELVTEFLLAAEEGNSDALKACLEKGVDINATNRQKRTAVIISSLKKHYDCVALLIAAGADIDKQDQTCFNPFLISCLTNDITPPMGACNTWRALYTGLRSFRDDLIQHIHTENNILFERFAPAQVL